jgi:hypothetical protein
LSIFGLPNIFKNFLNIGIFQFAGMLLQLLAIPLITRKYGLEIFGEIALTTSVAYLLSITAQIKLLSKMLLLPRVTRSNYLKSSQKFSGYDLLFF